MVSLSKRKAIVVILSPDEFLLPKDLVAKRFASQFIMGMKKPAAGWRGISPGPVRRHVATCAGCQSFPRKWKRDPQGTELAAQNGKNGVLLGQKVDQTLESALPFGSQVHTGFCPSSNHRPSPDDVIFPKRVLCQTTNLWPFAIVTSLTG
jgi:hypothetical protein